MKIAALAGGVGGAKLAHGLAQILPQKKLTIIVNTGDDFEYLGLSISPDLDTVCYTLAGLANPVTGWGRIDETWNTFDNIAKLGGQTWFRLGDRDLGTHLERTFRRKRGDKLSTITQDFCHAWSVKHRILPMTDEPVYTMVNTLEQGELPFQEYFVHQRCKPTVSGFRFDGVEKARPAPGVLEAINNADAVVFCPSNPWVSIDPILTVAGLRPACEAKPVVAVSPIIGGQALKGPAAKMYRELSIQPSALAVARHYADLLDGFVFDKVDSDSNLSIQEMNITTLLTNSIMEDMAGRRRLAKDVIDFVNTLL
ncbi:MAG: 2-phospho-L-lactate transferase [Anaerolineae bacterium]|jgi:LPPG:FO 2-phospho-L-lactate transferase|nr:2-phospho-L-lactate transferase [Anaerolineae bacterium]MBT7070628.1 2-phospho-L-lactate transferase [Anaerolineae bacterium]MBT7326256.1 2-phospho-L-lactate transferase [Anaerolineae bacterium]MBT7602610.1 2-phospho-L-lactate transferase [Anaerolineae bacterium]